MGYPLSIPTKLGNVVGALLFSLVFSTYAYSATVNSIPCKMRGTIVSVYFKHTNSDNVQWYANVVNNTILYTIPVSYRWTRSDVRWAGGLWFDIQC